MTIDRTHKTISDRIDKIQTSNLASTTVPPDMMQQLAVLQAKVTIFEAGQSGVSVRGGRGGPQEVACAAVADVVVGLLKTLSAVV